MSNPWSPFDQLGKKIGHRALSPTGITVVQHEIASNAHHADLCYEPDPERGAERALLGLLGRLVSAPCLIELFSSAPSEEAVLISLGKLVAYREGRRREHERAVAEAKNQGKPAPDLVLPFLWILCAGRPTKVLSRLGAAPAKGWPRGVYTSPGKPSREGPLGVLGGMLRVGIIVASELPRDRSTLVVRIMAGGANLTLAKAVADLTALPVDAWERDIASAHVLELRRSLGSKPQKTAEEEEFIVSTHTIVEELRSEGRTEGLALGRAEGEALGRTEGLALGRAEGEALGRAEGEALGRTEGLAAGRAEGEARALLTVLRGRKIAVPAAARKRILAETNIELLERWVERALSASTIAGVLDEQSRRPSRRVSGAKNGSKAK